MLNKSRIHKKSEEIKKSNNSLDSQKTARESEVEKRVGILVQEELFAAVFYKYKKEYARSNDLEEYKVTTEEVVLFSKNLILEEVTECLSKIKQAFQKDLEKLADLLFRNSDAFRCYYNDIR